MSFLRAAHAARAGQSNGLRILVAVFVVLAGFSLSCGKSNQSTSPSNRDAYVTLPAWGSVLLLHIDGATGQMNTGAQTPQQQDFTPAGLAFLPSKNILYAINSFDDTISIFNVAGDGTLTLGASPTPAGASPNAVVIDPSGKYLLVTNNFSSGGDYNGGEISVFRIDPSTGALSPLGSPVPANTNPTEILFTHSGQFVYVTNPEIGMVTGFVFCPPERASEPQCSAANGVLSLVPGTPVSSGQGGGALGLAVDGSNRFLYVTNPSATNPPPNQSTIGNISGFNIDPTSGALTPILGSPFTSTVGGQGPTTITIDPTGRLVYAVTPGSIFSVWCFEITYPNGQLVAVTNSPFSVAAGGQFALFDPSGRFFYIGSAIGIEAYTYNPSTGVLTPILGSPFSTLTAPGKMVFSE
ncbi:MAG TPA: beta-propeller fold lactonase family protein [Terriglobales bacterium]|nr:beta-propeller fold lactonase family protein [Terriglobales bacterium]